jgi:hypothetical protein
MSVVRWKGFLLAENCSCGLSRNPTSDRCRVGVADAVMTWFDSSLRTVDNINDFTAYSRHLHNHHWLSSFDRVTPYTVWIEVLFVFAGIVVRDRNWGRSPD